MGSATTRPRSGPAIPTSNSTLRFGMGDRMRMIAPMVPMGGTGSGMKYGRLTCTPYARAAV
jgi:hypothetical protein